MNHSFLTAVREDFEAVDNLIRSSLSSHVPLVEEIANYLVAAGGKRLRPLLVLLSAKANGYQGKEHIKLATIIEFLHTAMLLHDDVVDQSMMRRGRKTVNAQWGNPSSVLVGDFLHSRAFEMMVEIGDLRVMQILSRATNVIAEGEVKQLCSIRNPKTTEADYMDIIKCKTAMLFQAASHSGAVLAGADKNTEESLKNYGRHLGISFQLVDDLLDYEGDAATLGKNVGDDLAEGKVTLPIIEAMRNCSHEDKAFICNAITSGGVDNLQEVVSLVKSTGALAYTEDLANTERQRALVSLSKINESPYKSAMTGLINFVIDRQH